MGCPCVSVIMPVYNGEAHLEKTIRSVQAQTFDNWELIVVNDRSTDGTMAVLERLAEGDTRIRVFTNDSNSGAAKSRNAGIAQSKGEYIAFLDSDDLWHPKKLEKQLSCIRDTGADIVYTSYAIVDGMGNKRCRDFLAPQRVTFEDMLKENRIGCSTVMLKADAIRETGFPLDYFHEDYVLWLQMLRSGCKAVGIDEILTDYFFHEDSKAGNKGNAALERWKIYRKFLCFSLVKSLWYFAHYAVSGVLKYRKL